MKKLGQGEVLEAIEELGITTLHELHEELGLTIPSITNSLSKLIKWHEVEFSTMDQRRRIYLSQEVVEFLTEEEDERR